ncbi:MAG: hypothetical protein ABEJ72_06120 [Candidatus Aenigmatarchaeota archaeon]
MRPEQTDGFSYTQSDDLNRLNIEYLPHREQNEIRNYVKEDMGVKPSSVMYFSDERLEQLFEECGI